MSVDYRDLAVLIARYGMDAPHSDEPAESGFFPPIAFNELLEWQQGGHCGDCVHLPAPCPACAADEYIFEAKWIADRLNGTVAD